MIWFLLSWLILLTGWTIFLSVTISQNNRIIERSFDKLVEKIIRLGDDDDW